MTPAETSNALRQFNEWRRGDYEPSEQPEPPNPYEVGLAIDAAVEMLDEIERLRAIEAAAKNIVKVKGRYHTEIAFKRLADELEKQSAFSTENEAVRRETGGEHPACNGVLLEEPKASTKEHREDGRGSAAPRSRNDRPEAETIRRLINQNAILTDANPAAISELLDRLEAAEKDVALKERVIDALGSELAAVAKERAVMRSLVVMRFDHDHPPQFTQGYDTHEFAEPVTAEHCRWFVAEIERLRAELSAAKEAAAYHAHQTNEVSVALAASDAKIAEMKKQEPVAEMVEDEFGKYVKGINYWRHLQNGTKLYAFPGAKGE